MQESRISFNTTTLAKEKGFNLDCDRYYQDSPRAGSFAINNINNSLIDELHKEDPNCVIYYACPTQSLLQKWMREVHNIHIVVDLPWIKNGWEATIIDLLTGNKFLTIREYNKYHTYEEVLEEGLYQALKMI
ncbi:MAG: hypothetical protein WAZ19_02490 [Anaerolineae bacterium]